MKLLWIWALLYLISYLLVPRKSNLSGGLKIMVIPGNTLCWFSRCLNWSNWLRKKPDNDFTLNPVEGKLLIGSWITLEFIVSPVTVLCDFHAVLLVCSSEPQFTFVHITLALLQSWAQQLRESSPCLLTSLPSLSALTSAHSLTCPSPSHSLLLGVLTGCAVLLLWFRFGLYLRHRSHVCHSVLCAEKNFHSLLHLAPY